MKTFARQFKAQSTRLTHDLRHRGLIQTAMRKYEAARGANQAAFQDWAAARTAALAMAASRTGAVVAGIYAGIAAATVNSLSTPAGLSAFSSAVLASTGSVVLAAAALWLEGLCRLPEDDKDDDGAGRVAP